MCGILTKVVMHLQAISSFYDSIHEVIPLLCSLNLDARKPFTPYLVPLYFQFGERALDFSEFFFRHAPQLPGKAIYALLDLCKVAFVAARGGFVSLF